MLLPLTDNQEKVLKVIQHFISEKNYPPTVPEVQELTQISNPGAVHKVFVALERKGYLVREKGRHRGLDLTPEAKVRVQ